MPGKSPYNSVREFARFGNDKPLKTRIFGAPYGSRTRLFRLKIWCSRDDINAHSDSSRDAPGMEHQRLGPLVRMPVHGPTALVYHLGFSAVLRLLSLPTTILTVHDGPPSRRAHRIHIRIGVFNRRYQSSDDWWTCAVDGRRCAGVAVHGCSHNGRREDGR